MSSCSYRSGPDVKGSLSLTVLETTTWSGEAQNTKRAARSLTSMVTSTSPDRAWAMTESPSGLRRI